ncbi:ATP-binding cassette transporter [Clonorchis sinensis]|uniref:ATP-binding cassette transporter n=1 Tax=Clonorchis sinensis TaxID=79923 RepID=G7Y4E6_CLOSI|nr:ATP-binding cassette transporter [Clonorchis sinensis]
MTYSLRHRVRPTPCSRAALRLPKASSSPNQLRQVSAAEGSRADLARKLLETHSHTDDEDCLEMESRRSTSADLIAAKKAIPATSDYDGARRSLKRRIIRSLKDDREHWWISKAQEMEQAFAAGNSRTLIRSTGQKKAGVSEAICEKDGKAIRSLKRRLERWAERFKEQFNWSPSTQPLEEPSGPEWNIDINPSANEIYRGEALVNKLTTILQEIWNENRIPSSSKTATSVLTLMVHCCGISLVSVASKVLWYYFAQIDGLSVETDS